MIAKSSSKRDTNLKWLFFPLAVFGGFVFAYSYDTPSSVKDLLHNHFKHQYSESEFEVRYSFLYSLMALPNVFLTVFLGVLIDKFKVRINYWIMGLIMAMGASVTYFGVQASEFWIMYVGRFLLGSTGESIHIVEGLFLRQYFSPRQMSFVIAIIEAFLSLGGFLAFILSPRLAAHNLLNAFGLAMALCIANAFFIIFICCGDKWYEVRNPTIVSITHIDEETEKLSRGSPQLEHDIGSETARAEIMEGNHAPARDQGPDEVRVTIEAPPRRNYMQQILQFPRAYWFVLVGGATALSTIQSFLIIGPSYLIDKGYLTEDLKAASVESSTTVSLFRITAAVTLPFFGYLIDYTNKRYLWLLAGVILSCATHIMVIFINPTFCCVIYGCCYAIVATTLWPSVYHLIPKKMLGIATGIVNSIDNFGLMLYPALNAVIKSQTGSYDYAMYFLAGLTLVGVFCAYEAYRLLRNKVEEKDDGLSMKSSLAMIDLH